MSIQGDNNTNPFSTPFDDNAHEPTTTREKKVTNPFLGDEAMHCLVYNFSMTILMSLLHITH